MISSPEGPGTLMGIPLKVSLLFSYRQMASWASQFLSSQLPR